MSQSPPRRAEVGVMPNNHHGSSQFSMKKMSQHSAKAAEAYQIKQG